MTLCLVDDPFFPVITRSGANKWCSFSGLAQTDGDHPVDFAWPRPDFNIAAFELAIGIATLAFRPQDEDAWERLWTDPPDPAVVSERVAPFAEAFELDGPGPCFLQDFEDIDGKPTPIEALLIDTPGENGQKKNADLLTHRARYPALGLPASAMALYALQQFAPSGGAGNRTSMRGGGPMTTLVLPAAGDARQPLWRAILSNVVAREENRFRVDRDLPRILPWLAPTLVSDKAHGERVVHEGGEGVHPLQAFFGMPRRIRLVFGTNGVCAMTGEVGPVVTGFVQKPWGVNYGEWVHPLTPYRRQKEADPLFSVKPKSGRFGYRDWVSVTIGSRDKLLAPPALAIRAARTRRVYALRGAGGLDPRLRAAGWVMNNMEAVAYLFSEQPLHLGADAGQTGELDDTAIIIAEAADAVSRLLRQALRSALFAEGATVDTQTGLFEEARTSLFEMTEARFHEVLDAITAGDARDTLLRGWLNALARAALAAFDSAAPVPIGDPETAGRIAGAYRQLSMTLRGYGKAGSALFAALGLAAPPASKSQEKESVP